MSAKVKNRILFVVVCFFVEAVIVWMNWSTWSDEPIEALYWALRVIALIAASLLLAPLVFRVLKGLVWGYVAIGNGLARLFLGLFAENAAEKGRGAEEFLDQPLFRGFLGWMRFGDDRPFVDRALTPRRIIPWILFGWPLAVMPLLLEETLPFFLFLIGLAPFAMRQHRRRSVEVERRMVDAFTSGYRIRRARETDLDDLVKVEAASWESACDANDMFSRAQFAAHLEVNPADFFVAEDVRSGRLLGYVSGVRRQIPLDELDDRVSTWYALTDDGWYSSHEPTGNALFGASLGVLPEAQRRGIGDRLVEREFVQLVGDGCDYGFLGGRLPGMADHLRRHPDSTPEEYFAKTRPDGRPYDPELRFYADDFEIRQLLPGYFSDAESCNYGVLLVWPNPFPRWLPRQLAGLALRAVLGVEHWRQDRRRRKAPPREVIDLTTPEEEREPATPVRT